MFIVDRNIILDFSVFSPFLVVSTSATDCLERPVSEMTYDVLSGMLNSATTIVLPNAVAVTVAEPIRLQNAERLLISAPRLGVNYFLSLTLSVSPSICLSRTNFKLLLFFCFSMESSHFFGRQFSMWHSTKLYFLRFLI